jgi:hypothetical protein
VKYRRTVIIDPLPDDVLLEIFDLCLRDPTDYPIRRMKKWLRLAHVCQRWRRIIFASPRRLSLSLICTCGTPVRQNLLYWPLFFPLNIDYPGASRSDRTPGDDDNILAALTHADRIHFINIHTTHSLLTKAVDVMQETFPELTCLRLGWDSWVLESSPAVLPALPDGFLGGSAQRLQRLYLGSVSFPGLPTLLSSASNLVTLRLGDISHISPEAMVSALAVTTRLSELVLTFCRKETQPNQWRSPLNPLNRAILPVLTYFHFGGHIEYLEDLLALIDAPLLYNVTIEYFKESFVEEIQVPQLSRFIGRTEYLNLAQFVHASVIFYHDIVHVILALPQMEFPQADVTLIFSSIHAPRVVHALGQLVTMFSNVGHLSIDGDGDNADWSGMDSTQWLRILCLFPAVETMHLVGDLPLFIASALEETAVAAEDLVTELLPALHSVSLDDYRDKAGSMEKFLSLRKLSGRPVSVVHTELEFETLHSNTQGQSETSDDE